MRVQDQIIRLLVVVLFSTFVNCGSGVQVHGNTGTTIGQNDGDSDDGGLGDGASPLISRSFTDFREVVCDMISFCYEVPESVDCNDAVESDENLLEAFGVDVLVYQSFSEVDDAIEADEIELSNLSADCETELQSVSCQLMTSLNVYSENQPSNFSNIYKIVRQDKCGDLI